MRKGNIPVHKGRDIFVEHRKCTDGFLWSDTTTDLDIGTVGKD